MPTKAKKTTKTQPRLKDLKPRKDARGGARNNTIGGARGLGTN